ncbi:transcription factor IIF subunit TFG1 NDAI_0D01910 [Naumovozyma dairenensis CBS 421]|uniref:Uncharacterized protein n=1 Tax=Naumovozyma dairenensis (strain ATCC 10597 / BCRC 20456 / CBS 421 / NBRC 0211 / NRRL Y-12639) TaxID=1071378 RepID=G0W9P4_NAUDC|nr:hypothetical protein NDAI_0D01910 [Naumovozyma dairenensis CBS 421]CCD24505.1 hypothetical protein NDAI_0D01910 [Naumovozyma dairenensis CBS 421]
MNNTSNRNGTGLAGRNRTDTAGGGGGTDKSPFIKRDRLKRNFLRSRFNGKNRPIVKKDDPELIAKREEELLSGTTDTMGSTPDGSVKVKSEGNITANMTNNTKKDDEVEEQFNEFPLRAISKDDLENMRTHLLKFQSKKKINPNESFHLPIRLHRKDTRNLQFQLTRAEIVQRQKEIADYKKTQQQQQGQQQGNFVPTSAGKNQPLLSTAGTPINATIASTPSTTMTTTTTATAITSDSNTTNLLSTTTPTPTPTPLNATNTQSSAKNPQQQGMPEQPVKLVTQLEEAGIAEDPTKVGMVKYDGQEDLNTTFEPGTTDPLADVAPDGGGRSKRGNSRRKTRQLKVLDENAKKLRFEEFYPWVMEDYDGYNTWVGSYEAGNSDSYVMLSVEDDGSFTMIPADKVYKFTARNKYATLTIEEAEKRMDKKSGEVPRWLMKHLDNIGTTTTRYDRTKRRLKAVSNAGDEDEAHDDNSEIELDYDEEFDDDEEAPIIDGNEQENKESEQRIKREMLQANAMGLRDDEIIPDDDEDDLFSKKKIDVEGERIKKALQKTELAALYSSDDEEINPYLSESETEIKEEDEKKIKKEEVDKGSLSKKSSPRKQKSPSANNIPKQPKLKVKSINDCVVVLQGDKKILKNFPQGEWNPNAPKRKRQEPTPEESTTSEIGVKQEINNNPRLATAPSSPTPTIMKQEGENEEPLSKKVKTEFSADNSTAIPLITEADIIAAIGDGKVNVKDFGKTIRKKYPGPENKKLMFAIVKKLCRKVDNEHMELKK